MTTAIHDAAPHTCWDAPDWDGQLSAPGECAGCDEAVQHPCSYCGYGHVFTTHNDLAHAENGDTFEGAPRRPDGELADAWFNNPHISNA